MTLPHHHHRHQQLLLEAFLLFSLLTFPSLVVGQFVTYNPCYGVSDGWRPVDATNRITYVQCHLGEVVAEFNCPAGTYFHDSIGRCDWGTWQNTYPPPPAPLPAPPAPPVLPPPPPTTTTTTTSTTTTRAALEFDNNSYEIRQICRGVSAGKFALPGLVGFVFCSDGEPIVVDYCGVGTLYDSSMEACRNYCSDPPGKLRRQRRLGQSSLLSLELDSQNNKSSKEDDYPSRNLLKGDVILPDLAGRIECDGNNLAFKILVCPFGEHYDTTLGYCRNFCQGVTTSYASVAFPNYTGGVTCSFETVTNARWCTTAGTLFDDYWGTCVSISSHPSYVNPPTISGKKPKQTTTTTSTTTSTTTTTSTQELHKVAPHIIPPNGNAVGGNSLADQAVNDEISYNPNDNSPPGNRPADGNSLADQALDNSPSYTPNGKSPSGNRPTGDNSLADQALDNSPSSTPYGKSPGNRPTGGNSMADQAWNDFYNEPSNNNDKNNDDTNQSNKKKKPSNTNSMAEETEERNKNDPMTLSNNVKSSTKSGGIKKSTTTTIVVPLESMGAAATFGPQRSYYIYFLTFSFMGFFVFV